MSKKKIFTAEKSSSKNPQPFSPIITAILALFGFFTFGVIENLLCVVFSGKWWQYYILSLAVWIAFGAVFYFLTLAIIFFIRKLHTKNRSQRRYKFNESVFFVALVSIAPLFFYTTIQIIKNTPGRFFSVSNLIIATLILIIFSFICIFLYNALKSKSRETIVGDYLIVIILSGWSSISGVFLVVSELQRENWLVKIILTIAFCIMIPFLLMIILKIKKNVNILGKILLASVFIILLPILEINVISPIRNQVVFKQKINLNVYQNQLSSKNSSNIILIVMDTTRAANMSLYGYEKLTTPYIDNFANEAVVFKNAISSAPWTLPSHASLFTGLPSYLHGATHGAEVGLPLQEQYDTLAKLLTMQGFVTGAVVANQAALGPWSGLNQGFSYYWWGRSRDKSLILDLVAGAFLTRSQHKNLERICGITQNNSAKRINQVALGWLKHVNKNYPWFLFINYMETHGTNYLPSPYSKLYTTHPRLIMTNRDEDTGFPITTEEETIRIRSWYDNELASLDNEIGLFFTSLKEMGIYDETIIIVTSDHGELLGEHDEFGHAFFLYQELLQIPLIVKFSFGQRRGEKVYKTVQNIDIFAELLRLAGITVPLYVQGEPFSDVEHPIISEVKRIPSNAIKWPDRYDHDLSAIYSKKTPEFKLIRSTRGSIELYNLMADPKELNNISDSKKSMDIEKELDAYLNFLNKFEIIKANFKPKKLDEATKERLRALGYIK